MTVGVIAQIYNILTQAGIPQDRKINLTEYRSGKWTFTFMDNAGEVRYYEVTHAGNVIESDRG